MKKILTLIGFIFTVSAFAQSGNDVLNALKSGNASQFAGYFKSSVDIKFPKKDEMKNVSKAAASSAISDFFSANKINGFELTSQREMAGTMYIAGKLLGGAETYNITVMLKDGSIITVRIN